MDILPEPISFDWDNGNLPKNLHKHDVSYQEAEEMFSNDPLVITSDIQHSLPRAEPAPIESYSQLLPYEAIR
jgi:uncharacterized DUF497 family protein